MARHHIEAVLHLIKALELNSSPTDSYLAASSCHHVRACLANHSLKSATRVRRTRESQLGFVRQST